MMVSLVPMTQSEFKDYFNDAVLGLAEDSVKAGNTHPTIANQWAKEILNSSLPDGLSTPNHYLFSIVDSDQNKKVGYLWFRIREENKLRYPFLADIGIFPEYQRQGYATQAIHLLEEKVRSLGFDEIKLHVYAHNTVAESLYKKLGYRTTNIQMTKKVEVD